MREALLWREFRAWGSEPARRELLALHLPYARSVATSYCSRRTLGELDFRDCVQLTSIGLIESVDRFDPSFGIEFRSFAAWRMRGVLVDGIECMSEMQQQLAALQRVAASSPSGSDPSLRLSCLLGDTGMLRNETDALTQPFYDDVERREQSEQLLRLVQALPDQERRVIRDHYFQQLPFQEIAGAMKLTKGRISQIHKRALAHLRESLAGVD